MDRETCWQTIEQQRRAIADLLAELSANEWEMPSLCAGWRVREVAAHIALTPQPPPIGVMLASGIRARGNYNRFIDDLTRRYAKHPTTELVSAIRDDAGSRELPKLTNYRNILFDTMVHGQDIAIPLARTVDIEPAAAAAAAAHAVTIGWPVWDKHRIDGVRLVASDVDWSHGSGPEILGPITALLLLVTGRTAAIDLLTGDGVASMTARLR
ncbi:maleylpyruvate isomerase family mycothiol-dependent enzyme [Nocardia sp. NPDC050630]|uniref:maleylpyruvate isomerase family mycothiol-dependent enzyme n=1 Tax=Nocardia sp. NPDC050630 TaxID=3364321 RepID=UPI0037886B35